MISSFAVRSSTPRIPLPGTASEVAEFHECPRRSIEPGILFQVSGSKFHGLKAVQVQYIGDTNGSKHGFKLNELQQELRRRSIPCPARK
jgi:hypothetical protein